MASFSCRCILIALIIALSKCNESEIDAVSDVEDVLHDLDESALETEIGDIVKGEEALYEEGEEEPEISEEELLSLLEELGLGDLAGLDLEDIDLEAILNHMWANEETALPDEDYLDVDDSDWMEQLDAAERGIGITGDDEDDDTDPTVSALTSVLSEMYSSIAHGDSRYFNMMLKHLSNDSFSELMLEQPVMEAIESLYIYMLTTMHFVSDISVKIHAEPMQINRMNEGLLIIFKSISRWLRDSPLSGFVSDDTYHLGPVSFTNLLFCEGISRSLQFRLIDPLQFLMHDMNNTEQWYCFDAYHNLINQTFFHLATKSRAAEIARLFFHLPSSLPVLKYMHISNKGLMKMINPESPIVNQQLIKKRLSDADVVIILRAAFKLNLPNEWYLRKDINGKTAFDLWIQRTPHYLRFVYYHSAVSKLFSSHHHHLEFDANTCLSMQFISRYWPTIQWFPVPLHLRESVELREEEDAVKISHSLPEVSDQEQYDAMFPQKWFEQKPVVFRGGVAEKWNVSHLTLPELETLLSDEVFLTSHVPYEDLYESDYVDEEAERIDQEERSTTFKDFTDIYFNESEAQSANLEVECKLFAQDETEIPIIADNAVYWKNDKFQQRFNESGLIPEHIGDLMDVLIAEYKAKMDMELAESNETNETAPIFDRYSVVKTLFLLKEISIGPMYSGYQPTFRGPAFNALLMGQRQWIMFRPDKAFAMKQNAIEFFCYHESLEPEKRDRLEFLTFTQNPGDLVFVPDEWGYAFLNMEPSIGVSIELFV